MRDKTKIDLRKLNAFLKRNKEVDFRTIDLLHSLATDKCKWGKSKADKQNLLNQLKVYQRILRVVPADREDLAKALLKKGIHSAFQIANMPKTVFVQNNLKLFDNDRALAEQVYMRAIAVRKAVTLQYMARAQQAEPHARAAGLVR